MSESDLLIPYDFKKLQWQPIHDASKGCKRLLSGGELSQDTFHRYNKGDQNIFFGVYIDIASHVTESKLTAAAHEAWIWLRYHVPTIATHLEIDNSDQPWLVYRSEISMDDLKKWANRTFVVHKQETIDLDEIRNQVEGNKIPSEDGDQTWFHFVPGGSPAAVRSFGILFHSHHAPFDGSALKIILDRYLGQLAKLLGATDPVNESLQWGEESVNLLPAVFNVLAPSEPLPLGPTDSEKPSFANPYYAAMGMVLGGIGESLQNPYTFKSRPVSDKWPVVRRASARFTKEESAKVLEGLKHSSGGKYTLTHLAHAALAMTLIADNPPTPAAASQKIYNLSLANCRSSLKEPFNTPAGYPGYVLGVYSMNIPVSVFLTETGKPASLDKDTLVKSIKALRTAYEGQKKIPAAISYMAQATEIFSANIKAAVAANQLPPNHGFAFSSDGQGETYLRGTYSDTSGAQILSIDKFFTAVNRTDPGPFFRLWSWKGVVELSIDFNSNSISSAEVAKHIDAWKKFMLFVQDFGEADY